MSRKVFLNIFILLIASVFPLIQAREAKATEEFQIDSKITYQATSDVKMKVTHEVSLTNKLSNVYAQEYSFTVEGIPPTDISAWDDLGKIDYQAHIQPELTRISLPFNREVVGKDKTLNFGLSYYKNDLIKRTGDIWEIIIPKLASDGEVEKLSIQLMVPNKFGNIAFISPTPVSQKIEAGFQVFYYTKDQVGNSGVVAAFGEFQTFEFELTYHLENKENNKVITEIAIPPDTSYQKIYYNEIRPEPENIEVDSSGNWLAQYLLNPREKIEIKARGTVKVFAKPYQKFTKPEDFQIFLQPTEFWQTNNPSIQEEVKSLKTVKQIYNFVINELTYDYSRVREGAERLGAVEALAQPDRATCMEFTDLFVGMARAAGIPAREVNGFAFTTNPQLRPLSLVQDILHAWPEYWDESTGAWIQIDPTWQKTTGGVDYLNKLDLNHFSFVIHGEEDNYPPPAGAYKTQGEYSKDVKVEFGKFKEIEPEEELDLIIEIPDIIPSEVKTKGILKLYNQSPGAIYNFSFTVNSEGVKIDLREDDFWVLPPYSYKLIPLELSSSDFFSSGPAKIIIQINDQEFEKTIRVESFLLKGLIIFFAVSSLSLTIAYLVLRIRKRRIDSINGVC